MFWNISEEALVQELKASKDGLSTVDASARLKLYGKNQIHASKSKGTFYLFLSQFNSPLIFILFGAAALSFFLYSRSDSIIIMLILTFSGLLGFFQERGAVNAVAKLLALVRVRADVLRQGAIEKLAVEEIVPGDRILLKAGDLVPGDCRIVESHDLFVNEALLTGESEMVEKKEGILKEETPLNQRSNCLFMGTYVVSGKATALVVKTAKETEFGKISESLSKKRQETAFEVGMRQFGYMLMWVTLVLIGGIFSVNLYTGQPLLLSALFALSLAVGLTPQLLPAIVSVNLAHGARRMAQKHMIVKRLSSIENLGAIQLLCCDKTGTLTQGEMRLEKVVGVEGKESKKALFYTYINAFYQSTYDNPIDKALVKQVHCDVREWKKKDELPYDFGRKRLSILVTDGKESILITKGAVIQIFSLCRQVEKEDGSFVPFSSMEQELLKQFETYCHKGYRVLAVSYRKVYPNNLKSWEFGKAADTREGPVDLRSEKQVSHSEPEAPQIWPGEADAIAAKLKKFSDAGGDKFGGCPTTPKTNFSSCLGIDALVENEMIFLGFLLLMDPIKEGIGKTLLQFQHLGVDLKVISGDHSFVVSHLAQEIGLLPADCMTGSMLAQLDPAHFQEEVVKKKIFAEIEPNQKEAIILALRKSGSVVAYLGDGINDVTALSAADVGISVNNGAAITKEVSDIVLLKKDLSGLCSGIEEGRRTFANTLKYIFMATSANFGNMFSMAGASVFFTFLPMLPEQILLTNFLTDLPEMTIAQDRVDPERLRLPVTWDIRFIRRFMIVFGLISSLFDYLTFGVLYFVCKASVAEFRTGWFIESVLSASLIILVIRTRKLCFKSLPSTLLFLAICATCFVTLLLPFTALGRFFNFERLPWNYFPIIFGLILLYAVLVEVAKFFFYGRPRLSKRS